MARLLITPIGRQINKHEKSYLFQFHADFLFL